MTKVEAPHRLTLGAGERVGIVAGGGALPAEIADALEKSGHKPFVMIVDGEADALARLTAHEHGFIRLEDIGRLVSGLKARGVTHLVLAGGIERRPRLGSVRPSLGLLRLLPRVLTSLARGDDSLLRAIIRAMESSGLKLVGAHQIVPDLLAAPGVLTKARPLAADRADLHAAAIAARAIGLLDIGQAAIAVGGRAIALEGIEGTDCLLERTQGLRGNGRIAGRKRGVLVKCAKPQQEMRADLPTIGPATVDGAYAAGLVGIGVEVGRSIILDQAEVIARADRLGMFVVGMEWDEFE